jgi:glycosyltransferase involved in cell wall biosynthesis
VSRVVLVTSYFWPDHTGVAVYSSGLARHLADAGDEVAVVTGMPHYPSWRACARGPEEYEGIEVRRHRHYVPHRQTALRRTAYEAGFLAGGLPLARRGPQPDVVIGVSPCLASARVALAAGRRHDAPVGLVFQDLLGLAAGQVSIPGGRRLAAPVARLERAIASAAEGVGITSPGFRGYFESDGIAPGRITDLRNWVQRDEPDLERAAARARLGWGREFVCLHAGNMGQKQGLDSVIRAAERVADGGVRVVFAGDGNDRARLQRVARGAVCFEDVQPPGRYEAMLAAADVLLLSQRPSVRSMSLASRLTAYFAAGRPVLAAVAPGSETAAEVRRSGAGRLVAPDDPEALARAILALRHAPEHERAALGAAGAAYAQRALHPDAVLPAWSAFVDGLRRGCVAAVAPERVAA